MFDVNRSCSVCESIREVGLAPVHHTMRTPNSFGTSLFDYMGTMGSPIPTRFEFEENRRGVFMERRHIIQHYFDNDVDHRHFIRDMNVGMLPPIRTDYGHGDAYACGAYDERMRAAEEQKRRSPRDGGLAYKDKPRPGRAARLTAAAGAGYARSSQTRGRKTAQKSKASRRGGARKVNMPVERRAPKCVPVRAKNEEKSVASTNQYNKVESRSPVFSKKKKKRVVATQAKAAEDVSSRKVPSAHELSSDSEDETSWRRRKDSRSISSHNN